VAAGAQTAQQPKDVCVKSHLYVSSHTCMCLVTVQMAEHRVTARPATHMAAPAHSFTARSTRPWITL